MVKPDCQSIIDIFDNFLPFRLINMQRIPCVRSVSLWCAVRYKSQMALAPRENCNRQQRCSNDDAAAYGKKQKLHRYDHYLDTVILVPPKWLKDTVLDSTSFLSCLFVLQLLWSGVLITVCWLEDNISKILYCYTGRKKKSSRPGDCKNLENKIKKCFFL